MSKNDHFTPQDRVPLPPAGCDTLTTACDYCTVACGYKVYRWPVDKDGTRPAVGNALGSDFPHTNMMGAWISPTQHNIVQHQGRPHHVVVVPDKQATVVNVGGNHSIRGGTLAQKCYNPDTKTRERLTTPMIRVNGTLTPVGWDLALEAMADISKYILAQHGPQSWGIKMYSYQYFENTYAITKLGMNSIGTAWVAPHDKCANSGDATGLDDTGIDSFSSSFQDWGEAEVVFLSGVDPHETKTTLFTQWMMPGDKKFIFVTPHQTMGVAWALREKRGIHLPIIPGTDTVLHLALARLVIENGWQDQAFIDEWVADSKDLTPAKGAPRKGWSDWHSDWAGYRDFILAQEESRLDVAARITGLDPDDIRRAAEWIARPKADGTRPKTSFMLEKGNYWSNNYMNSASLASLGLICGAGNRPGRVVSRSGGHQRGMISAGGSGRIDPVKFPGKRAKDFNLDCAVTNGELKFVWVFGTTWVAAMMASGTLESRLRELTRHHDAQITSLNRGDIFEALKRRVDTGGMVLIDSDIYPVAPLGTDFADIVLPAATWGEDNFTRCNSERRLRLYSRFYDAPGQARPDWWAVQQFAHHMGFDADGSYAWKDSNDVFEEASQSSRGGVLNYHALVEKARAQGTKAQELLRSWGTTGIQTPIRVREGQLVGTARLHDPANRWTDDGRTDAPQKVLYAFNTPSGKATLLKSPWTYAGWLPFYEAVKPRADRGEIWVTSGRFAEIWQSGFDDRRKSYLHQRWPDGALIIHPDDAKAHGIESGDQVEVSNDTVYVQMSRPHGVPDAEVRFDHLLRDGHIRTTEGHFTAVAIVSDEIRPGVAKANFNVPSSPSNAIVSAVPDPMTNNYRYKLGHGRLRRVGESPYKHSFTQMSLKPRNIV